MSGGWTKGPWAIQRTPHGHALIRGENSEPVCGVAHMEMARSREVETANANLIAAAPDLYDIAARWAAIDGGAWHPQRHARDKAELLADTRAALSKARGEPSPSQNGDA